MLSVQTSGTQQSKITDGTNTAAVKNTTPTGTDYGLVVRNVGTVTVASTGIPVTQSSASALNATVRGFKTNNASPPLIDNLGAMGAVATTAAPSYTDGNLVFLSTDLSGNLRTSITGSLPLPTGAATESTLSTLLTQTAFNARINTLGQKTAANSTPVVLASDQSTLPVSVAALPLPSGAATESTLTTLLTQSTFTNRINTLGQKTSANSTPVVLASDQSSLGVSGTVTANQGGVWSVGASQSGTWTVQPGNTPNTTPWLTTLSQGGNSASVTASNALKVDGSSVTQPVSGTITANQGGTWNINNISGSVSLPTGAATAAKQPALGAAGAPSSDVLTIQGITSMTPLKVDGSAITQPISGTVTANQGGTWTVQPGNTANTTPWLITVSQGGLSAAVETTVDGNEPGLIIRPINTVYPTFSIVATGVALGNNKSMISLANASGSTVVIRVREIWLENTQTAAVTGVVALFELRRFTSHSAGTTLTAAPYDTVDTLNGSVTARTGATITGETVLFMKRTWSTDEWGTGTLDEEGYEHAVQSSQIFWSRKDLEGKAITLRANEGVHIKCATNTTAGTFDFTMVFTQATV